MPSLRAAARQEIDALTRGDKEAQRRRTVAVAKRLRPQPTTTDWPPRVRSFVGGPLKRAPSSAEPRPRRGYRPDPTLQRGVARLSAAPPGSHIGDGRAALAAAATQSQLDLAGAEECAAVMQLRNLHSDDSELSPQPRLLRVAELYCRARGIQGRPFVEVVGRLALEYFEQTGDGAQLLAVERLTWHE